MRTLHGTDVYLRALEPTDLAFLYAVENTEDFWEVSNTVTPYSKQLLQQYLDNAHRDIFEIKQLRLAIARQKDDAVIGLIDLFDFEPKHRRAGVGILIAEKSDRDKGFAQQALQLLCEYAKRHLSLHQLYANISEGNGASVRVFEKVGFEKMGRKRNWIFSEGSYKDEWFYQLFL